MFPILKKYLRWFSNYRNEINEYFITRFKGFWKKKIPVGKQYSYIVHDPFEVLGFDTGFEKLYLVGDNWVDCPEKPVAIVIGCNDWKFGFIADYLPDYRVAFGSRKKTGIDMVKIISKLSIKPKVAIVWGYNENIWLRLYLTKFRKIPLWRCEDGFIRSADLGANGATPYSLVFDKTGLYYNSYKRSDIEILLNTFDFKESESVLDESRTVLKLFRQFKMSKYNPPIIYKDKTIKLKHRVLVIGQVDSDASLKYGNPDKWSMEEMVKLAKYENPSSEILYRPHPEVYQGYQKSKFKSSVVDKFATILSPDEHIVDLIERVDHIYTITSLSGLEALLYGKKVTVLGKPFYAGWGLTDDRAVFNKQCRQRKLTLLELFTVVYVIYPKYFVKEIGYTKSEIITAIIGRITADKGLLTPLSLTKINVKDSNSLLIISKMLINRQIEFLNIEKFRFIFDKESSYFNKFFTFVLLGLCKNDKEIDFILCSIREIIDIKIYNEILLFMSGLDSKYGHMSEQWQWLLLKNKEFSYLPDVIERELIYISGDNIENTLGKEYSKQMCINRYELYMETKNYIEAEKYLNLLALLYIDDSNLLDIFKRSVRFTTIKFDFNSAEKIANLMKIINPLYSNRFPILESLRISTVMNQSFNKSFEEIFTIIHNIVAYKPDKIFYTENLIKQLPVLQQHFLKNTLTLALQLDNDVSPRKINGLISVEQFEQAEKLAWKNLRLSKKVEINDLIVLSQALSFNGKVKDAIKIMENYDLEARNEQIVTELLRLYVLNSDYKKGLSLLKIALNTNMNIGEMYQRKIYFGNRMLGDAFKTFKDLNLSETMLRYFPDKYLYSLELLKKRDSFFLLSIFGPGDEIRWASIYNQLKMIATHSNIYISCAPRLKTLFERSFPGIHFVAVEKPRNDDLIDLNNYKNVPGYDISGIVDDMAMETILKVDSVSLVSSVLGDILLDYNSFLGHKYLIADKELQMKMLDKLSNIGVIKIGLSWRSGVLTSARNEHYLSVENLEPLFNLLNVQFINLQYDECSEEVAWVNERYPGKLINFEDIDQYNDFESVAALMSCLDLVIAPATTVAELAGALGVKTWLFSNSSEIDWRKIDEKGTDVWHNSITIVDVPEKGNKQKLVEEIFRRLEVFAHESKN